MKFIGKSVENSKGNHKNKCLAKAGTKNRCPLMNDGELKRASVFSRR